MTEFRNLTYRGQLRRLNNLGRSALIEFGLDDAKMKFIHHGENTTYRIDARGKRRQDATRGFFVPDRYVLRIHRTGYQNKASVESEMHWMQALLRDTDLAVPQPLPARNGEFVVEINSPGVPEPRHCDLLCWLDGRFSNGSNQNAHFHELGKTMAHMHDHVRSWKTPNVFDRRHWDWEGLFGNNAGFYLPSEEVWDLIPNGVRKPFAEVADEAKAIFADLGNGPDVYGLIHADLHLYNVHFLNGNPRVFDFDDCGFGHFLYDMVVPIGESMECEDWEDSARAFLAGYSAVRSLPPTYTSHLDAFLAMRRVSLGLWAADMARANAGFSESFNEWIHALGNDVHRYVRGERVLAEL